MPDKPNVDLPISIGSTKARTIENWNRIVRARGVGLSWENTAGTVGKSVSWLQEWRRDDPELERQCREARSNTLRRKAKQVVKSKDDRIALAVLERHDEDWRPKAETVTRIVLDLPSLMEGDTGTIDWVALDAALKANPALAEAYTVKALPASSEALTEALSGMDDPTRLE